MNFKQITVISLFILLTIPGCSTEPELDLDKLDDSYIIMCKLEWYNRDGKFVQNVLVQRIRYLVDYVFNPDKDQTFGVVDAQVKISGPDSIFHFEDMGYGVYEFSRAETTNPFRYGERYALSVVFPSGNEANSEIVTPMIYFQPQKDTLWIQPDSITDWYYPEWGGKYPLTVAGPNFRDTITFDTSPGALLDRPRPERYETRSFFNNLSEYHSDHLWVNIDTTSSLIIISTASDSPSVFISEFEPTEVSFIILSVAHKSERDYENLYWDDTWPVENLEEVSNINGAYGIFTSSSYVDYNKQYILAVKKE